MKKIIYFLFLVLVVFSCSTRKKENKSTFMKGFSTYYNTLFNAKDALNTEFTNRSTAHKDNFYAPFIPLLKYDEQPLGSEIGQSAILNDNTKQQGLQMNNPGAENEKKGATILEIAEAKASKAINTYSVLKKGEERNKIIFDAHIILAQSRIYQNKNLEAINALNYLFTNMKEDKRLALARIYEGLAYAKMKDYFKADQIFTKAKANKLPNDYAKLLSIYSAQLYLDSGKKEQAIAELGNAFELNKNKELRSRISFLKGQILESLGKNVEARESFASAYENANDFEFEVKSQIEIAKTYGSKEDYQGAKEYLEKISKKGTYASKKNEFYYALGLLANKAGKPEDASEFFAKSLKEKVSDPQIRGLVYSEIGKSYLDKNEYISAGAYFDSALVVMNYEPTKIQLNELNTNIKEISKNYYLIKKNDSILALSKMSEAQKKDYFSIYIKKLKEKEEKAALLAKKEERLKGFESGDYNANSVFANSSNAFQDFSESKGGFYFASQNSISKGNASFKQIWGDRALSDNWRASGKSVGLQDLKDQAMGVTSAPNPRRLEPEFYIEKIPNDPTLLANLKKDRDTASLGLGMMYDHYFSNVKLATKTLYDLVDVKPQEEVMLKSLYHIFYMNYEKNPALADRAKQILLTDYPYTSYAEFARNPKSNSFTKSSPDVESAYKNAYALYESEKYEESKTLIDASILKYPKDVLVPKFYLLNAFNAGKTNGKEVMILQLEQIALNYGKTPEGIKAKELLNYLKSDIKVVQTDNKGNAVNDKTLDNAKQEGLDQIKQMELEAAKTAEKKSREIAGKEAQIDQGLSPVKPKEKPVNK